MTGWWLVAVVLAAAAVAIFLWLHRRSAKHVHAASSLPPAAREASAGTSALSLEPIDHTVASVLCMLAFAGDARVGAPRLPRQDDAAEACATALSRLQPGSRHAPRRPRLLPQLLGAVNDDDASGRVIAGIIAQDPALAGNLLRVANSAFYRVREQPIESIERAVAMIGTDGVRRLIAVTLLQPVFDGGADELGRLLELTWEHGQLSAAAAVLMARQVEHARAFDSQMLGLLHGLGAIAVLRVIRDEYAGRAPLRPTAAEVGDLLERWTMPVAQLLADDWGLTPEMRAALDEQAQGLALERMGPLARSLALGRFVAALALQHRAGGIDGEVAEGLLVQRGLREPVAARIWRRLAEGEAPASAEHADVVPPAARGSDA